MEATACLRGTPLIAHGVTTFAFPSSVPFRAISLRSFRRYFLACSGGLAGTPSLGTQCAGKRGDVARDAAAVGQFSLW